MIRVIAGVLALSIAGVAVGQIALEAIEGTERAVVQKDHPDATGNKFGFEGGNVLKLDGVYHLVTAEMVGEPLWYPMKLAHWKSTDGVSFQRVSTLFESTGGKPWTEQRASLAGPMFIFNDESNRWELHYVTYRGNRPDEQGNQMDGTIVRAVSRTKGTGGIAGPYDDVAVTLKPDADSQKWEGQQGTDSIFPFKAGDRWLAFYGSHQYTPIGPWYVGLVEAKSLSESWKRLPAGNPVPIDPVFVENPVVIRDEDGVYLCVYDSDATSTPPANYEADPRTIGFTWSRDGVTWSRGRNITVLPEPPAGVPWRDVRTPLGLVSEGDGRFTCLYTARMGEEQFWELRRVELRRK